MKYLLVAVFVAAFFVATPAVAQPVLHPTVTFTLSATNNNGDRDPATPGLQVDESDIVTLAMFIHWTGDRPDHSTLSFGGTGVSVGSTAEQLYDYHPSTQVYHLDTDNIDRGFYDLIYIIDDVIAEPDETLIFPMPYVKRKCYADWDDLGSDIDVEIECDEHAVTFVYSDPVTITIRQNDGYVAPVDPDPVADNSTARAERLDAPTAAVARGVGMLAADAVTKRLHTTATANQLNLGRATAAEELLRRSDFNLAGGGFNFWGGGEYVSTKGDHDGIDYDGDTSAFTLGIDTGWRDGLIGVAVSRSDSDIDSTVPADGIKFSLETEVTSVHPYLTHRFNHSQLWLSAGHGSGDAELKEPDAVIKTDITVTTAALGLRRAHGQLSGNLSALYSRAKLDEAASDGKTLPATSGDNLRVAAAGQVRWQRGAWQPFVDFTVRHDSGDGDTGIAGDLGGGIEYRAPTVVVRLTTATTIAAESAEETRASLTVRKSSGDFDLGLNLSTDGTGIDTARLLTGEWRF